MQSTDRRITVSKPTVFGAKHLGTFLQRHGASRRNTPPRGSKPPRCPRGGVHRAGTRAEEGVFRDRDLSASGLRRRAGAFPDALASGNSRNPLFAAFISSSHLTRRRKGSGDASESRPPLTGTPNPFFLSRRFPQAEEKTGLRAWFRPGRVWIGTIVIPGGDSKTRYVFQVVEWNAAARRWVVSHAAHGDEQL